VLASIRGHGIVSVDSSTVELKRVERLQDMMVLSIGRGLRYMHV